ncbi:MAG: prolyl oligopeptidase family serine peptidase [Gammaproteobacteria bacterium]|nr:prolyl oligopeptidase family serine peptidase [Gammaproteobacteria bacterium]
MNILTPNFDVPFYRRIILTIYCICFISLGSQAAYATRDEDIDRGSSALQAQVPDVHEKILKVPLYSSPTIRLQVTVYTPDTTGPFPMVILNHGNADEPPKDQPRSRLSFASLYFLSRGYAVVQPMMRGYAGSEGKQNLNGCDVAAGNMHNAEDIASVIYYMGKQPYIDGSRVIVAGQSFGGFNSLAVGTLNIPAVKGIINFNGGSGIKECSDQVDRMVDTAGYFAARTKLPSIWFYGSNDRLIPESTWRAAYHRYTLLGGDARLVAIGNFKDDSHNFLGHIEGISIIQTPLDDFFHELGLPNTIKYPGFVPPIITPTHFADLNDVNAVPISPTLRPQYQKFLTAPLPRAFLILNDGGISMTTGGVNPLAKALESCKNAHIECTPYAIDQTVVWNKGKLKSTPLPPPSHYADINDVDAVPVSPEAREGYRKFLSLPLPRAFLISKNSVSISSGGIDPLAKGLQACQQQHIECWPYAVDNQVVWVKPTLTPTPPPSNYADIKDLNAVPIMGDQAKAAYQAFLSMPLPRVFVLTNQSVIYSEHGGLDPLGHILDTCQQRSQVCIPYAVDNQVVWSPTADFLKPTHFADIRDFEAVPYMNTAGRKNYQKFLTLNTPRAFVIAPDGTSTMASNGSNSLQIALSKCQSSHHGCAAYALDNDVVWDSH